METYAEELMCNDQEAIFVSGAFGFRYGRAQQGTEPAPGCGSIVGAGFGPAEAAGPRGLCPDSNTL